MPTLDDLDFLRASLGEALTRPGVPQKPDLPEAYASVAMVVHLVEGQPCLLWIRRAEHPQDPWSGQMAFPGGKGDPEDDGPRATAERETLEELGLALPDCAELVGTLTSVRARSRRGLAGFRVDPHLYLAEALPDLRPDASEVASTHSISLAYMADPANRTVRPYPTPAGDVRLPAVKYEDTLLWGLSYRFLKDLLDRVQQTELGAHLGAG